MLNNNTANNNNSLVIQMSPLKAHIPIFSYDLNFKLLIVKCGEKQSDSLVDICCAQSHRLHVMSLFG